MSVYLQWPPRDRKEMRAWQERYGDDVRVGQVCGRKPNTVLAMRRKFGIDRIGASTSGCAGGPIGRSDPFEGCRTRVQEDTIAIIYDGRSYTDVPGLH